MRRAVVGDQLDHLRVDHHEVEFIGLVVHQQAGNQRVDAHALARTGRAGDEQVRHQAQVGDDGLAGDVLSERNLERRVHLDVRLGLDHRAQVDQRRLRVRHLDADHGAPGNGRLNANGRGGEREREVVGQPRDGRDFDLDLLGLAVGALALGEARLDAELRDGRPLRDLDHACGHAEVRERLLDDLDPVANLGLAKFLFALRLQHRARAGQRPLVLLAADDARLHGRQRRRRFVGATDDDDRFLVLRVFGAWFIACAATRRRQFLAACIALVERQRRHERNGRCAARAGRINAHSGDHLLSPQARDDERVAADNIAEREVQQKDDAHAGKRGQHDVGADVADGGRQHVADEGADDAAAAADQVTAAHARRAQGDEMDKRERDQVEHGRANGPLQADVRNFV